MGIVHGHKDATVPAGEFKQRCLALLDQVSETGVSIVVTKRGRAVARVVPVEAPTVAMQGSLRVVGDDQDLFSTGESWEAEGGG
jgi:prevent-host-death family protein